MDEFDPENNSPRAPPGRGSSIESAAPPPKKEPPKQQRPPETPAERNARIRAEMARKKEEAARLRAAAAAGGTASAPRAPFSSTSPFGVAIPLPPMPSGSSSASGVPPIEGASHTARRVSVSVEALSPRPPPFVPLGAPFTSPPGLTAQAADPSNDPTGSTHGGAEGAADPPRGEDREGAAKSSRKEEEESDEEEFDAFGNRKKPKASAAPPSAAAINSSNVGDQSPRARGRGNGEGDATTPPGRGSGSHNRSRSAMEPRKLMESTDGNGLSVSQWRAFMGSVASFLSKLPSRFFAKKDADGKPLTANVRCCRLHSHRHAAAAAPGSHFVSQTP